MSGDQLAYLMAEKPSSEILNWLRSTFLPEVLSDMNSPDVRRRIGLYGGDRIPENERNLTDVRNRVSLIAEYEMARVATRIIEGWGYADVFVSYVVANRFPDLELRNADGRRGLRIEIKCLEAIAEEKSANFDTLRKDVHPNTDYIVIFLWEWKRDSSVIAWDRAPQFLKVFCFHATSLAHIRDWYWLNKPPGNLVSGRQGFDLRYAVNCSADNYNEEEGNYGKLMRMWTEDFAPAPQSPMFLPATAQEYLDFRRSVVEIGFEEVCRALCQEALGTDCAPILSGGGKIIGWSSNGVAFVLNGLVGEREIPALMQRVGAHKLFRLSDKYSWNGYRLQSGRVVSNGSGRKPKHLKHLLLDHRP